MAHLEDFDKEKVALLDEEDRAINTVLDLKKEALEFYQDRYKEFKHFDRLYIKGAAKKNSPYGRANLDLPLAFQQIEPFVSQMTETMLGEAPYIAYQGRTIDDEEAAEKITDFTQSQLDQGNFLNAQTQHFRNLGKYGTAVMKVIWEVDSIEVESEQSTPDLIMDPETGEITEQVNIEVITEEVITHDGPRFHNLSLNDFFVPPSATTYDIQQLPECAHRTYRSLEDLINNPNYKMAHKELKKMSKKAKSEDEFGIPNTDDPKKEELERHNSKGAEKFEGKNEVLEWWGDYKFDKDKPARPALIVVGIVNGKPILLRKEENPFKYKFKPFVAAVDYPISGEFYGYGELHHVNGLITESTALRNARLDIANQSLNPMWLVERQAGINLRELYSAPNKVILTNDLNGMRDLRLGQVTTASANELAKIDFDIQNTTEIINPRQDVSSVGAAFGGTATGVNFLSARSNLRLLTKARLLEQTYFKQLAIMLNMYNKDMVEDDQFFRITNNEENPYSRLPVDAWATEVDFKPTANPQKLTKDEQRQNLGYLIQTMSQFIAASPTPVNLNAEFLLKEVAKISGFSHPEQIIKSGPTVLLQMPDGSVVDQQGQPPQIQPVDENGEPVEAQPGQTPDGL